MMDWRMIKYLLRILVITGIALSVYSCKLSKEIQTDYSYLKIAPPGTVEIKDNLYFDKGENSNIDYREFLYWNSKIYGKSSMEYMSLLPDSSVWRSLDINYSVMDSTYFRGMWYDYYPLVGISYKQALAYSKWRSDRVLFIILIENGVLDFSNCQSPECIFTIEKYYNSQYMGVAPNPYFSYYPYYSLPDSTTYHLAKAYVDSLIVNDSKKCELASQPEYLLMDCRCLESIIDRLPYFPYGLYPTEKANCSGENCSYKFIYQLAGNVRELTNTKGLYYGISFRDSCHLSTDRCRKGESIPNSYTGFRNMCTYKKWNF